MRFIELLEIMAKDTALEVQMRVQGMEFHTKHFVEEYRKEMDTLHDRLVERIFWQSGGCVAVLKGDLSDTNREPAEWKVGTEDEGVETRYFLYCSRCGHRSNEGTTYCPDCGTFMDSEHMERKPDAQTFRYGGWTFQPVRKFVIADVYLHDNTGRLQKEPSFGLMNAKIFAGYDYDEFYKVYKDACGVSDDEACDIFRCMENGRLYVPDEDGLQLYEGPDCFGTNSDC